MKKMLSVMAAVLVCSFFVSANSEATPINYTGEVFNNIPVYGTIIDKPDYWRFSGHNGDIVTIAMDRVATNPPNNDYGTLDPYIILFRGSDDFNNLTYLTMNDDGGSDTPSGPWRNALISNYMLLADGDYTIFAHGVCPNLGPYKLTVDGISTPVPEPATMMLFSTGILCLTSFVNRKKKIK